MLSKEKNVAVLVTYNKEELLKECLNGVMKSIELLENIVIVNNDSTDGTAEYLSTISAENEKVVVVNEAKNLGGAAGFNKGIKQAMKLQADTIWVMDDDTIPDKDTLKALLNAKERVEHNFGKWGVLASNVRWVDGSAALMNVPEVAKPWNESKDLDLIAIRHSSFVSMLVSADAIKHVGYPISDFFIWGDDVEFSERISAHFPSFCVTGSLVTHKMARNQKVDILTDDLGRISRYYYDVRNKMYMVHKKGMKESMKYYVHFLHILLIILFSGHGSLKKIRVMLHGFFDGIFFRPRVEKYES